MRIVPILLLLLFIAGNGCRWALAVDTMLRGSTLENPEWISGSWETDQFASIVGLHIRLTAMVAGAPSSLIGVKQVFHHAEIQVYQRDGPTRTMADGNWFEDDSSDAQWAGRHLTIEHAAVAGTPAIQLILVFDSRHNTWRGHLRRGTFDHYVTLARPHPKTGITKSPFVGTWYRAALMNNCLLIVQTGDGALSGWSDDLATPGRIRYANNIERPTETMEQYGSIALVQIVSPTTLRLELKAFSSGCCSIFSLLQLRPEIGAPKSSRIGSQPVDKWRRVEGSTCVEDASSFYPSCAENPAVQGGDVERGERSSPKLNSVSAAARCTGG
jgi:hypothetical protein